MRLGWGPASLLDKEWEGFRVPREELAVPRTVLPPGNRSCHIPVSHEGWGGPGQSGQDPALASPRPQTTAPFPLPQDPKGRSSAAIKTSPDEEQTPGQGQKVTFH